MDTPHKADPIVYSKLRENALRQVRLNSLSDDAIHLVLMDWNINDGMVTVLAAADGTASIYLSGGTGFIGGSQKYPEIRETALLAVRLAAELSSQFSAAEATALPSEGEVFFYATTNIGLRKSSATVSDLSSGTGPLAQLGAAMQQIIAHYSSHSA
jgi:hypothetical protein